LSLMIFIQNAAQQEPKIAQTTVLGILIASTLIVLGLLGLIGIFAWKTDRSLEYGSFFVVVLGILTALVGFLVAFPLLVSGVFDDPTQVLALLSALFGTIVGLVGTYFGIKTSSDARNDAQTLARDTIASDTTPPTVSSVSPLPNAMGISPDAHVTATFSKDMDPATLNSTTFKLVERDSRTPVPGSIGYDTPTNGATYRPRNALANNTYEATITRDVKDKAGNALA
jgi:ABC-type transport system involved in multi-copper enzyme maturation permease subunit